MVTPSGDQPGDVAYIVPVVASSHAPGASVGELLAFTYASEGNGPTARAQVLDIREGVTADTVSPHLEVGAVASGQRMHVWVHVKRNSGTVHIRLRSKATAGGGFTNRVDLGSITGTGLYTGSVGGAITHRFWELHYNITGTSDFDIAAAVVVV